MTDDKAAMFKILLRLQASHRHMVDTVARDCSVSQSDAIRILLALGWKLYGPGLRELVAMQARDTEAFRAIVEKQNLAGEVSPDLSPLDAAAAPADDYLITDEDEEQRMMREFLERQSERSAAQK